MIGNKQNVREGLNPSLWRPTGPRRTHLNIHKMVKEWPITASIARSMLLTGQERRVYITLRSPSRREKGRGLTVYRIPFNDVVKSMRAAFPKRKGKPVYVTMLPVIPRRGKMPWSKRRHRGPSVHLTAYGYVINELPEKIKNCLGTIVA